MPTPILNKGDIVEISALDISVKGEVVYADYWDEEGWDIEIINADIPGGYSHWKQQFDGGKIISVNGKLIK